MLCEWVICLAIVLGLVSLLLVGVDQFGAELVAALAIGDQIQTERQVVAVPAIRPPLVQQGAMGRDPWAAINADRTITKQDAIDQDLVGTCPP